MQMQWLLGIEFEWLELTQTAEARFSFSDTLDAWLSGRKQEQQRKKDANFAEVVGSAAGALGVLASAMPYKGSGTHGPFWAPGRSPLLTVCAFPKLPTPGLHPPLQAP